MSYDNTNRGSIWKNDKKSKETDPDYTGSINIEGVDYWLNGWRKSEDAAEKAPVLKFTVRKKGEVKKPSSGKAGNSIADLDSDIPW